MNEYDSIINDYVEAPASQAATSINESPDQAVRARQLSRATNQPVLAVYNDLDNAEQEHRAALTRNIVSGNDKLAAYIRGNDLADVVSNDDYGNLDNASRAFSDTLDSHPIWGKGIPKRYIAEPLMEGLKGALYGIGEGLTQSPLKIPENYIPASKWAYEALGLPLRGLNAIAGGFMGGAGGLARQATIAAGGDENQANRAEREARGIVESEMGRGGSGLQHADRAIGQVVRQQEALARAKPWLDAGVDVPRGVHPLIDQIKEKTNDAWVDKIQNALQEAQNSATRERDPELFKNFAKQHFEDAQMGISADAVVRLYGDKLPSREDGILGWIPGIEDKLEAAKTFGEDVHVPLADWVTYVDPQLASELKPDLRAWPGGITKNEAAIKDIAAPAIDGALPQVRSAAGLEPAFAIGDRRLELKRETETNPFQGMDPQELAKNDGLVWEDMSKYEQQRYIDAVNGNNQRQHSWEFHDEQGNVVGQLLINPNAEAKQLYVDWVGGLGKFGPSSFGPSLIRDIKRQLKEAYPEYETIAGHRVSGARYSDKMIEQEAKKLAEKDGFKWEDLVPSEMTGYIDEAHATYKNPTDKVVTKLALGDAFELSKEYTDLRRILETAPTKFGDVTADLVPKELWTKNEHAINQAMQEEVNRIAGKTAKLILASDIRYEGVDGIRGVYHQAPGEVAKILVAALDPDKIGILRHELIHHLYRNGFFKPEEWNALIEASKKEGWIERYRIKDRYPHLNELGQHEEAIAEAFREWAKTREQQPVTPITTIFQKLWDLMQRIKDRVAEILGREPRFDELFEAAYSGELAQRAGREGEGGQAFARKLTHDNEEPHGGKAGLQKAIEELEDRIEWYKETARGEITPSDYISDTAKYQTALTKQNAEAKIAEATAELEQKKAELANYKEPEIDKNQVPGGPKFAKGEVEPPIAEGMSRLYHGGLPGRYDGKAWFSTDKEYARNYRQGSELQYVDVPTEWLNSKMDPDGYGQTVDKGFTHNIELDSDFTGPRKPLKESAAPEPTPKQKEELQTQLKAEAAGLDAKSFKRIQDLIQKRYQEDIAAAMKRAEAEQKTLQSKEWKEAAKEIRKEVDADIRQRPDVAADLLIGSGELGGKQLERKNYPLRAEDLSEAQKASLPRRYYSKDGIPVDMMANLFGFTSGDRLIEDLSSYTKSREGMSAQEGLRKTIDEEVQRRMEEKFGKLQDNIMLEAMDQALSETNLQILAEEWQGAAMAAGVKVVDKDIAKGEALTMFGKMKLSDINVERLLGIMGKIGRDTERLLIAGKNADALVLMQRKYMTGLIAAEARKLQKEQASFEKTAKQFSKREVSSVDPEYTNYIHQILMQVGKPVRRSVQDLAHQMEGYGGKNLEEFVQEKAGALREIPVWDQLYDPNWNKSFDQLTADEFRALHGSIKALVHNGRDEMKIMRQGEAEDLAIVKQQMIQNVIDAAKGEHATLNKGPVKKFLTNYYVGHLQMENIFNRWDKFDSKGVWNQYIMRDLIDGANQKDAWLKEYAHRLKQLPEPEGLTRTLNNPLFKDQDTGATLSFTRKNLIAVMLNTGNSSNLAKLAKGYKIEPNDVMAWVHQHASKKDWEFVQGIWDMFADIKKKSDTMYRSLTGGVAPESIPIRPVDTPHGQFKGGYYPVIFHSEMEGKSKRLMGKDPLEQENYVRATTPAGYTKTRTGYAAPMALELDAMPGRIGQMLHDIALRPAVLNAAKIFYDHDVRSAIRAHFGAEYRDELVPYLRGVANASNYESKAQTTMNQMSEFIRQNMITTLVGLNPGTVMKHGPTAAVLSVREVGAEPFANAVRGMFSVNEATGESNWQFAIKNSLELQRRDRNWAETLYGSATGVLAPGDKLTPMRQKIMELSSKPVALSDMISAVPTWLAKYESEINAGATHGDAVYEADRSVRRAHGSTAITTRTAMMRNSNPWLVSIYNFFSDVMNRQMETIWKAGETKDLVKQGEWKEAAKTVPPLTASLFAYAIWPAIVETWVSPHPHKDDDSWLKKSAMAMTFALGSSWVGVRDIASAMTMGRDPQFGLTGTAYQTMTNTFRDLTKKEPFNKEHAGKILQDAGIMIGGLTGMLPAQVSKSGRFLFDVSSGQQKPKGPWQWLTGLRYGTIEKHPATFEDYLKGKH